MEGDFSARNIWHYYVGAPIFLSLDLPDEPKEIEDEDKSEEMKALEARRIEFYKTHVSQAANWLRLEFLLDLPQADMA